MKRVIKTSLAIFIGVASCYSTRAQDKAHEKTVAEQLQPIPKSEWAKVPAGHPRVWLRPEQVDGLRKRYEFNSPITNSLRAWVEEEAKIDTDGTSPGGKAKEYIYKAYEANALQYLLYKDEEAGLKAKSQVIRYFETLAGGVYQRPAFESRRKTYAIRGAAMVYDWCYDLFTPEERLTLISEVRRVAESTEFGWPRKLHGKQEHSDFLTGHWSEEKFSNMLLFGIACFDEDPSFYNLMTKDLYEVFAPLRNFKNQAHKFEQGTSYSGRFIHELESAAMITGMGGENPYTDDQAKVFSYRLYARRPDGIVMPEGDGYGVGVFEERELVGIMAAAKIYQDPLAQGIVHKFWSTVNEKSWLRLKFSAAMMLCLYDEKLKPANVEDLPLTRYFPYPQGNMIARTGWDLDVEKPNPDSSTVLVKMDMAQLNMGGHAHGDAGHFSIYHKGPLAIESGAYANGTDGKKFAGIHHENYYTKTIAHNTLLIYDPDAKSTWGINDGGQFVRANWDTPEDMIKNTWRAEVLGYEFGPDPVKPAYSYLSGDMTRAYRNQDFSYPNKVKEARRSFVFLNHFDEKNPATLIVFDRITSRKPGFVKTWLLHSEQKPEITGMTQTLCKNKGKLPYQGKLVNRTLLPDSQDAQIKLVGGPGREFEVQGVNYALQKEEDIDKYEAGRWRIELSPKKSKERDLFLNVMQIMDTENEPLAVTKVHTDQLVGAVVSDRLVLFNTGESILIGQAEFTVPKVGKELKTLITDVSAGKWQVKQGKKKQQIMVTREAGTIYVSLKAGKCEIKQLK